MKKAIALFYMGFLGCLQLEAAPKWFDEFNRSIEKYDTLRVQQLLQDENAVSNLTSDQVEQVILTLVDRVYINLFDLFIQSQNMIVRLNGDQRAKIILDIILRGYLYFFEVLFHNEMVVSQINDDQWIQIVSLAASNNFTVGVEQLLRSDRVLRAIIRNEQTTPRGVSATIDMLGYYYNSEVRNNLIFMRTAIGRSEQLQTAIADRARLSGKLKSNNRSAEEKENLSKQLAEVNERVSKLINMLIKRFRQALSRGLYIFANEIFEALPEDQRDLVRIPVNEDWAQRFFDVARFGNSTFTLGNSMISWLFRTINNQDERTPYNPMEAICNAHELFSKNGNSLVVALLSYGVPTEVVKYMIMQFQANGSEGDIFTRISANGESTIDAAFMINNLDLVHMMHSRGAIATWHSFYYAALREDASSAFAWLHDNFPNIGEMEVRQAIIEANRLLSAARRSGNAAGTEENLRALYNLYQWLRATFPQTFTQNDAKEAIKITNELLERINESQTEKTEEEKEYIKELEKYIEELKDYLA